MQSSPVRLFVLGALVALVGCGDPLPSLMFRHCYDDGGVCPDAGPRGGRGDAEADAAEMTCSDGMQNNDESDVDCGGTCEKRCDVDAKCSADADCDSMQCVDQVCVKPPTAAFSLSTSSGPPRLRVRATSTAQAGSAPIREVTYDWDDGLGFEPSDEHIYDTGGSYVVRQRVVDEHGSENITTRPLEVTGSFRQARFSATDHSDNVVLSADRMSVENRGLDPGGVRSDVSVMPMSRVYYFEVERLIARAGNYGFGVATADETLANEVGHQSQSMGVLTSGGVFNNRPPSDTTPAGQMLPNCTQPDGFPTETRVFGFVVDYRGMNPRVHIVIDHDMPAGPVITNSCTMGVSAPLHIFYSGSRYEIGPQARINTGADTTNHAFHFSLAQLVSALAAAGQPIAMADIVYGFGGTRAQPANTPPNLTVPMDRSVPFRMPITLSASATDAEETDFSSEKIHWLDMASQHHAPVEHVGSTFTFTPSAIGRHPIEVSARDNVGNVTTKIVQIDVTGDLPMPDPVVLAPDDFGGKDVMLSDDALSARFMGPGKYGIRANTGIYRGGFQYFEAHREKPAGNMGVGVIIGDGLISPYHFETPPWSCSVNLTGNTWRNLIDQTVWKGDDYDRYGFAVDYRGEHPIVHILIGGGSSAKLESSLTLDDVWVPIYPMVYGNPQEDGGDGPDISINFGATPFQLDPRALVPGGSAMQLGWGVHNQR